MDDLKIIHRTDGHTWHLNQKAKKEKENVLHTEYGQVTLYSPTMHSKSNSAHGTHCWIPTVLVVAEISNVLVQLFWHNKHEDSTEYRSSGAPNQANGIYQMVDTHLVLVHPAVAELSKRRRGNVTRGDRIFSLKQSL